MLYTLNLGRVSFSPRRFQKLIEARNTRTYDNVDYVNTSVKSDLPNMRQFKLGNFTESETNEK